MNDVNTFPERNGQKDCRNNFPGREIVGHEEPSHFRRSTFRQDSEISSPSNRSG